MFRTCRFYWFRDRWKYIVLPTHVLYTFRLGCSNSLCSMSALKSSTYLGETGIASHVCFNHVACKLRQTFVNRLFCHIASAEASLTLAGSRNGMLNMDFHHVNVGSSFRCIFGAFPADKIFLNTLNAKKVGTFCRVVFLCIQNVATFTWSVLRHRKIVCFCNCLL